MSADSHSYIKAVLDMLSEGIFVIDRDGKCTLINPAGLAFLGYSLNEIVGKEMHALCHWKYPDGSPYPKERCPLYRAIVTGQTIRMFEEILWHKDGRALPALYSVSPLKLDGEVTGAVVAIIDIGQENVGKIRSANVRVTKLLDDLLRQSRS